MADKFVIVATYTIEKRFRVPMGYTEKQVKNLISNNKANVMWNTLYINDGDKEFEIDAHQDDAKCSDALKRPDDLLVEEASEWDYNDDEEEGWDELLLELNHGNCFIDGRHPDTSDEDWKLYLKAFVTYNDDISDEVRDALNKRPDIDKFWDTFTKAREAK